MRVPSGKRASWYQFSATALREHRVPSASKVLQRIASGCLQSADLLRPTVTPSATPTPAPTQAPRTLVSVQPGPAPRIYETLPGIRVQLVDSTGRMVPVSPPPVVEVALRTGSGTLRGTLRKSIGGGDLLFGDLRYEGAPESIELLVSVEGRGDQQVVPFTLRSGPPHHLQITPLAVATVGVHQRLTSFTVVVQDAYGNPTQSEAIPPTIGVRVPGREGALTGRLQVTTDRGVARFDDLQVVEPGASTLEFFTPTLAPISTASFQVVSSTTYAYAWDRRAAIGMPHLIPWHWVKAWEMEISLNAAALAAKAATDQMPEGHRVLYLDWYNLAPTFGEPGDEVKDQSGRAVGYHGAPYYGLWWDRSAAAVRERNHRFAEEYKRVGGKVDYIVVDSEQAMGPFQLIGLAKQLYGADPDRPPLGEDPDKNLTDFFRALQSDPRYSAPQAAGFGQPAGRSIRDSLSFGSLVPFISDWASWRTDPQHRFDPLEFSIRMNERATHYKNFAYFEPYREYFPDVALSEYDFSASSAAYEVPDTYGQPVYRWPTQLVPGTRQAPNLYGNLFQLCTVSPSYCPGGARPFNAARHQTNWLRAGLFSAPQIPMTPWFQYKESQDPDHAWFLADNDYYQELLFSALLQGAYPILFWNPQSEPSYPHGGSGQSNQIMNDCLATFDTVAGGSLSRTPLETTLVPWNSPFVRTCMRTDKSTICRVTLDIPDTYPRGGTVESEYPARVRINAQTLQIDGGRIVYPEEGRCSSQKGFWVEVAR